MEGLKNKLGRYGYTLIELLVVLALFAIVLSIALPSISIIFNTAEKKELLEFRRNIIFARNSAIIENRIYMVRLVEKNNGYQIITGVDRKSTIIDRQFVNGIVLKGNNIKDDISFSPSGSPSKSGTIELTNRKSEKITISITPVTGKVNLEIKKK